MHKEKTIVKIGIIFLLLLGLYAGARVSIRHLQATAPLPERMVSVNHEVGLHYDGPRMDVVQFRELLMELSEPAEPGSLRALKLDNKTGLPLTTPLLTVGDVTTWDSRVALPEGEYVLVFENGTPVKYRPAVEDELMFLVSPPEYSSGPDMLRRLLDAFVKEARELENEWETRNEKEEG